MTNKQASEEFHALLEVCDRLLSPEGCPWDREQTLISMRESILEEACEVIEAIDEGNDRDLVEELGDLLYNIVFFCKLGEKEYRFETREAIVAICKKLISRHPHVFGEESLETAEEVRERWDQIKKKEKSHRESLMDGIPKGLPALARSYKIAGKMQKAGFKESQKNDFFQNEEELGELLWRLVQEARHKKINPEMALRKKMVEEEASFRNWEKTKGE